MKYDNSDSPNDWRDVIALSLVISVAAIILAGLAIKIPFSKISLDDVYSKTITLAGIIIGVFGVLATVYFVVVGIDLFKYKREFERMTEKMKKINAEVARNKEGVDVINSKYNDVLDVLSLLEGISKDGKQTAVIRLAIGRMICKSETHSDKYSLELGIRYLGDFSRSQEDIDLLEKIKRCTDKEGIKKLADNAINIIGDNKKRAENEAKISQSNLRWWRNSLGLIRN